MYGLYADYIGMGMQRCMEIMGNQMEDEMLQTLSPFEGVYRHSVGIVPESNAK